MKKLIILVSISLLVGCVQVGAFRITSVPDQAKVYVNGEYAGMTPYTVHADWYKVLGINVGDRMHLTVDKEGYKTIEKDISVAEREAQKRSGNNASGSGSVTNYPYEFRSVITYPYDFRLEPLQNNRGGDAK